MMPDAAIRLAVAIDALRECRRQIGLTITAKGEHLKGLACAEATLRAIQAESQVACVLKDLVGDEDEKEEAAE